MYKFNQVLRLLMWVPVVLGLFGFSSALARKSGCWVKIYPDEHYQGRAYLVHGPRQLRNLVNLGGKNWDKKIESIIVGPKAVATLFENKNFELTLKEMANYPVLMKSMGVTRQDVLEDSELIFQPDVKVHNFSEFQFYHKIRSMKVECVS